MLTLEFLGTARNRFRARQVRQVSRAAMSARRSRRGSALILTLVLTLSLASLATSAIYLGSNAQMIATSYDQERDMRYAAEAMLAMGKSNLNYDPYAAPDTGYITVQNNVQIMGADNQPVPGLTASLYMGPTSSNTGQFGRFVSVVAVVQNGAGAKVIRRLELAQESFAKFAYWSNQESNNGQPIYFNNGDQLWGPVWSNDQINIGSLGATFHGSVGTAQTVSGVGYGTFDGGPPSINQKPIALPNNTQLAALAGYAGAGSFRFAAPNASSIDQTMMRIEFVAKPFNNGTFTGPVNGPDDGFFRVYVSNAGPQWLRGDFSWDNCGAAYVFVAGTGWGSPLHPLFVPLSENRKPWFANALNAANTNHLGPYDVSGLTSASNFVLLQAALGQTTARCYLGGDPNLHAVNIRGTPEYSADSAIDQSTNTALALAGSDSTFTAGSPSSVQGYWIQFPGVVDPRIQAGWPVEAPYLFPLYRGLNPRTKGVIYVGGTTGISGTLRGRVTLYATGSVAILRDMKYVTDPALNLCSDILGVISGHDIMIADNAPQDPVLVPGIGFKNMDDTKDVWLQGVMMALNTAFGAENYDQGPGSANNCGTVINGRGCLELAGGIIQQQRGPVGVSYSGSYNTGFAKRYTYDTCALYNPPPYFPTTGRYTDNRYYELDPNGFDVAAMFRSLRPGG